MIHEVRTPLSPRFGADDRHALRTRIHETLLMEIVDGTLPPGAALDEERTAERLRVPRPGVREALLTLSFQRLVEYTGADTARVTDTDIGEARHIAAVLHGLYRTALLTAPWPMADDRLQALHSCAAAHAEAAAHGDGSEAATDEAALWETIVLTCANRPLYDAVTHLAPVWKRARRLHLSAPSGHETDWGPLLDACTAGDRPRALHHLDEHWARISQRLDHATNMREQS
ncbi:GntR family transcriptional regulator [Streptomyces capoamus]|uniref:GntR family transcriptional regulator n=1 Tax=Streptomyces capoamus TaxID=68183 RepID=UPI003C2EDF53